jgi:hypothetical protein
MATPDMSAVAELCAKAKACGERSQHANAADAYAAAVAACLRAQQPGMTDCLVLAHLRSLQIDSLWLLCFRPGLRAAEAAAAQTNILLTLLPAAMTTLERRRAADTLLPGKCRPAEEAWFRALHASSDEAAPPSLNFLTYICTARTALSVLVSASVRVVEPAPGQEAEIVDFVARALDLIVQAAPVMQALLATVTPHDGACVVAHYEQAALADAVQGQVEMLRRTRTSRRARSGCWTRGTAWSAAAR